MKENQNSFDSHQLANRTRLAQDTYLIQMDNIQFNLNGFPKALDIA